VSPKLLRREPEAALDKPEAAPRERLCVAAGFASLPITGITGISVRTLGLAA